VAWLAGLGSAWARAAVSPAPAGATPSAAVIGGAVIEGAVRALAIGRTGREAENRWRDRGRTADDCGHGQPEYARHNGHADLLRERIDGRLGQ
jgi:hypothetical protein